jgi:hypothetical protein
MITRRNFIKSLVLVPTVIAAGRVTMSIHSEPLPHHLYGIPYHQTDATIGTWLGIDRSTVPQFSSRISPNRMRSLTLDVLKRGIK